MKKIDIQRVDDTVRYDKVWRAVRIKPNDKSDNQ